MAKTPLALAALLFVLPLLAPVALAADAGASPSGAETKVGKLLKPNEAWKKEMTPAQYKVMREKGTERPRSGRYWKHKGHGTYVCSACGHPLFSSESKYESGTGWPSFWAPIDENATETRNDRGMTEIVCAKCESHLGHVFPDGPKPTGQRYCMNSVSLEFKKAKK